MGAFINETGNIYGRLTVISKDVAASSGCIKWKCSCSCGNIVSVRGDSLRSGNTLSCKCLNNERALDLFTKHGMNKTPTYISFYNMLHRCYRSSHKNFNNYGGRGIKVCDRWKDSFDNFFSDMGEKPTGMTLDRIDNDKNYDPNNCRWATQKVQNRNTSRNTNLVFNGETKCITDWAKLLGISEYTLRARINRLKWSATKALSTPVQIQLKQIK
jgi:hypothetical protein